MKQKEEKKIFSPPPPPPPLNKINSSKFEKNNKNSFYQILMMIMMIIMMMIIIIMWRQNRINWGEGEGGGWDSRRQTWNGAPPTGAPDDFREMIHCRSVAAIQCSLPPSLSHLPPPPHLSLPPSLLINRICSNWTSFSPSLTMFISFDLFVFFTKKEKNISKILTKKLMYFQKKKKKRKNNFFDSKND